MQSSNIPSAVALKPGEIEHVYYRTVPYFKQSRNYSCWYASAKMLFKLRNPNYNDTEKGWFGRLLKTSEPGQQAVTLKGRSQKISNPNADGENVGATEKDWGLLTKAIGLQPMPVDEVESARTGFQGLITCLKKYGPLWCAGYYHKESLYGPSDTARTGPGHIILVIGAVEKKAFGGKMVEKVIIHDPGEGGHREIKYTAFKNKLFLLTMEETEGVPPIMYLPEKI
jgi:hypothetical protein